MFGNNPYDLVAPAMMAELHHALDADGNNSEKQPAEGLSITQRIVAALTANHGQLKLSAANAEGECSEA